MHSPIATYLTESLTTVVSDTSGELANYIPELAAVDPDKLAASIVMVDGEQDAADDQRRRHRLDQRRRTAHEREGTVFG